MRKKFIEPEIIKIAINLSENIATSLKEEETELPGFKLRQMEGTPGGCQRYYVKTNHEVVPDQYVLVEIYLAGCVSFGSKEEQQALRMMRRL